MPLCWPQRVDGPHVDVQAWPTTIVARQHASWAARAVLCARREVVLWYGVTSWSATSGSRLCHHNAMARALVGPQGVHELRWLAGFGRGTQTR